jgi:hypothetical protein
MINLGMARETQNETGPCLFDLRFAARHNPVQAEGGV